MRPSIRLEDHPIRIDDTTEQAVIAHATDQPAHGQHRASNELRKKGVFLSGSGMRIRITSYNNHTSSKSVASSKRHSLNNIYITPSIAF